MPADFIRQSSRELDAKLEKARSVEEMRSILKADAAARGVLIETQGGFDVNLAIVPQKQAPERPDDRLETGSELKRMVRIGDTVTLLTAGSVRGLDILEHHLRQRS